MSPTILRVRGYRLYFFSREERRAHVHVHHADGEAKFSSYEGPVDDAALPRARFLAACRGVGDVAFGLDTDRREYVESGLRALTFCVVGETNL